MNLILLRYGELHLKGKNRDFFENLLIQNIRNALKPFDVQLEFGRSRYIVTGYDSSLEPKLIKALQCVFGLHSLSVAERVEKNIESILQKSAELVQDELRHENKKTFRVNTHRADKHFPLNSMEVSREAGAYILEHNKDFGVDLHNPTAVLNIDIRENNDVFLFTKTIKCAGGMPVGSAGKGMLLLSGGIDSPVSAFMMAKRGLKLKAVHFASPPYTSEFARQKVLDLAQRLTAFNGVIELFIVPFTKIQEAIHEHCDDSFMITIMRRIMIRISNILSQGNDCHALITGESLGQVASQTLESITATNSVSELPVLRPLIAFDKEEIIEIAKRIDTFDISIRPHDDCCTVFLPARPQTKPKMSRIEFEEAKLTIENLILDAVEGTEKLLVFKDNIRQMKS